MSKTIRRRIEVEIKELNVNFHEYLPSLAVAFLLFMKDRIDAHSLPPYSTDSRKAKNRKAGRSKHSKLKNMSPKQHESATSAYTSHSSICFSCFVF